MNWMKSPFFFNGYVARALIFWVVVGSLEGYLKLLRQETIEGSAWPEDENWSSYFGLRRVVLPCREEMRSSYLSLKTTLSLFGTYT